MKKILLALMLLLLPHHAVALPHFYTGVGTISADSGKRKTTSLENGSNTTIESNDYIVRAGYGLSVGFSAGNVAIESRWLDYGMIDRNAPSHIRPTDITEQTTHLIGRMGTNFFGVRLSMGYGKATMKPGDPALSRTTFDVLSKGIGVDFKISLLGKTRIFVDYYNNSYQSTKFNGRVYQQQEQDHTIIYGGMTFPLFGFGSIAKAATPG
ncbi:MAG: hypothetical protein K0U45_02840 [Alphaproteobacteria bacterium]|nr:hypothetical protein [Alphaproteobacteria bacterium]